MAGGAAAIVGAGIGGVSAALALALSGWQVRVFEQSAAAEEVGAGLQLGPNAVKVLDTWGLGAGLRAVSSAPRGVEMRDDRTFRLIATVPLGPTIAARHGAPYLQIHRADLLRLLLNAAMGAGVAFTYGQRVADWAARPKADLVLAADGIRSALRAPVSGASDPRFSGQVAWRATVHAAAVPGLDPAATLLALGPRRHLVAYTLRDGALWNIVAVREDAPPAGEGWRAPGDAGALRHAFADAAAPVRALLAGVDTCILWGLYDHRPLPRWRRDNVALIGDAAHPMLPFMAQGAAMAIEDAAVLAGALARHPQMAAALAAYETRRRPRTTRLQRVARGNARIYHAANPLLARGLHGAIAARAALPGGLLGRFDWLYGWTPEMG
ncbi:MAG: FAD-dependent monooxygenase [Pseudomonadota bacterium]